MKTHLRSSLLMNWNLCLSEVRSHKTRSFISSFGVFLGVATLLLMFSFLRGIRKDVNEYLDRMGGLSIVKIESRKAETDAEKLEFKRSPGLKLSQIEAVRPRLPGMDRVLPMFTDRAEVSSGGKSARAGITAVGPDHLEMFDYQVASGRAFGRADFDNAAHVCIIGSQVADRLFPKIKNVIGQRILYGKTSLEIVGILYTENRWDRRSRELLFPFSLYQRQIGGQDPAMDIIKIKLKPGAGPADFSKALKNELIALHRGVEDFEVILSEDKMEEQAETDKALVIMLWAVAILSLLLGGISITNIMFASLGDRIREIGLHKALGATKLDLFLQFIIESILLCVVGGLPGMALGAIPAALPEGILPMKLSLAFQDYSFSFGCVVLVGFLAGIFPALKAAKMPPIEALQYG